MPATPSRKIAYQILLRMESGVGFAVDLLQAPEVSALKEPDRRLATEIVMGVLRWRGELDFQVERLSGRKAIGLDPEVLTVLRIGAYQIRFLERVPKRAAVDDAVELTKAVGKRSASGLVNAVLRKCDPPRDSLHRQSFEGLSAENRESVRRAFPEWMLKRWECAEESTGEPGDVAASQLAFASLATPRTTLRVVDASAKVSDIQQELEVQGVVTSHCEYAEAYGLKVESGQVQNSTAYCEGRVVIQDEASQLVAALVSPEPGQRVLDLCAAPGMKAGQLAHALGDGVLIACDRSGPRLRTLSKLLPKWVPAKVRLSVVRVDAAQPLPFGEKFDRVLLDAPCTGTGTLARNPEIKWRLRPNDITRLAKIQFHMLRSALPSLLKGGRLVYSTCSLEPEENEEVVARVLSESPEFRVLSSQELASSHPRLTHLFNSSGQFSTRPDRHSMDGFRAAVIVRKDNE